jgi:hypothetical protein
MWLFDFQQQFESVSIYNEDSYLNSELYYKITGRKGAWVYKNDTSSLVVCQHPHNPKMLLVFPEVGEVTYELTASVLHQLYRADHEIRLARYTQDDYEGLKNHLAKRDFNLIESLDIVQENDMDWKYPVHILDTQKVAAMYGKKFEDVRAKFNKAQKYGVEYTLMNKETAVKDMRAALKYWEGSMIAEGKDTDDMTAFYERFFGLINAHKGQFEGLLFSHGRRPTGFMIWDQVGDDYANGLVNLADISITGLGDFQIGTLCQILHDRGIKYLNIGGSETERLDYYKQKFQPVKSIPLLSVDVQYKNLRGNGISYAKFV